MKSVAAIDTNVVVAGILRRDPDSPVCRIVDGMLRSDFPFVLSPDLIDEYRRVLLRPKIRALHKLSEKQVDVLLTEIVANAIVREPPDAPDAPDRSDNHLWQLLHLQLRVVLITGDRRLIENPPQSAAVLSPRAFIDQPGL